MSDFRPNIVLVHGHDVGRWISPYGFRGVPAPALESLAARSVVFDEAFATAPLCSPARGSLFTGLLPHQHGLMGLVHHAWRYRTGVRTMPELLAAAGYRSAMVGLQHENVDPNVIGFDEVLSGGFLPRALPTADMAARWIASADAGGDRRPFFLTVGFWEAHRPWPAEDYAPVTSDDVAVPAYLPDNDATRADIAAFAGAVRQLDQAVGRVVRAVDESRFARETMIVFTTDHGPAFPRAKSTLFDAGVGVSLVVRPPAEWRSSPGRRRAQVSHLDLLPTFLDAAGVPPGDLLGRSLLEDLAAPVERPRELFFEKTYHDGYDPVRAVRTGRHKLIKAFGPCRAEPVVPRDIADSPTFRSHDDWSVLVQEPTACYDLASDPDELVNLAHDPANGDLVASLESRLHTWMLGTDDPLLAGHVAPPPPRDRERDALPALAATAHDGAGSGARAPRNGSVTAPLPPRHR